MKKYRNKLLAVILSVSALLSFSSCENDYSWVATTLDFEAEVPLRNDGYFNYTIRILDSDIADYRPSREELVDIRTLDGWLIMSNFKRTDRVSLRLVATGGATYDHLSTISPDINNEYIINDDGYFNFMADAIDMIRRNGYVDITITGESNIRDRGPLVFTFENNVDIYVRD